MQFLSRIYTASIASQIHGVKYDKRREHYNGFHFQKLYTRGIESIKRWQIVSTVDEFNSHRRSFFNSNDVFVIYLLTFTMYNCSKTEQCSYSLVTGISHDSETHEIEIYRHIKCRCVINASRRISKCSNIFKWKSGRGIKNRADYQRNPQKKFFRKLWVSM